ncbi:hypothetical protein IC582_015310 [Cucumis melo]
MSRSLRMRLPELFNNEPAVCALFGNVCSALFVGWNRFKKAGRQQLRDSMKTHLTSQTNPYLPEPILLVLWLPLASCNQSSPSLEGRL